jgi:nitrogen fixation protein NifU and related proteins
MTDIRDLYQELILDHGRRPRNFRALAGANRQAVGHNPLCGDKLRLYVRVEDGRLRDVTFEGAGCAISTASASLMTEAVKDLSEAEARALFERFHEVVTGHGAAGLPAAGEKLAAFAGVSEFPVRVKCATLPWHTLVAALAGQDQPVKTE